MAPLRALVAVALLCTAGPAAALEETCRVPKGALNTEGIPETMMPGRARETAGLDCGGQASAFCTELRRAFTLKTPPRLKPETIKAACDARAAEHWTGVWQGLLALQRGHNYSDAEKAAARDAFRTVGGALYRVLRGVDRPVLDALEGYYLNKTFVVSPEEDRRVSTLVSAALGAFEARLPDIRAARLSKEDWGNWAVVRDLVERYYYAPGSNLPEEKELLRRFDALAAWFDVHELLDLAKADAPARARLVADGRLTQEGEAAAARAKQGRERLRLFALERVALAIEAAPASARGEDVREAQTKARQRALDAARALGQDALLKEADDLDAKLRAPGTVPKPLSVLLDPANLPADIPAYMARFDPAYTAFVLKLTETGRGNSLMSTMRDGKTDPLTLRLRAAEVIYADITARRRCGEDRACFRVAVEEERLKVRATLQGTPGGTRWLMLAAARNINQQKARDGLLELGKALIPGYACYELYDHWGKSTGGQKAADAAFCGLGAVPVVSAIARTARMLKAARAAKHATELEKAELRLANGIVAPKSIDDYYQNIEKHARPKFAGDIIGISERSADRIARKLGTQGQKQTCVRHAFAATLRAQGQKRSLAEVSRAANKILTDAWKAENKGAGAAACALFDPDMMGMYPHELKGMPFKFEMGVFGGHTTTIVKGIEQGLAEGKAVIGLVGFNEGNHAVAVLRAGKDALGNRVYSVYDSNVGAIRQMYAQEMPFYQAVWVKAPSDPRLFELLMPGFTLAGLEAAALIDFSAQ